jgi:hypothetical protein
MQDRIEKNEPIASAGATAKDIFANLCFFETKNNKAAKSKMPIGK